VADSNSQSGGFSRLEREAMNARAKELAAEKRADRKRAEGEIAVRDAIDAMSVSDKAIAEKIHQLVTTHAPDLWPKTWYGMPAYARDGKVICFFQAAGKFDARYATFGFNDPANLDDGNMWATSFAILELNQTEQDQIVALIRRSVE
jgi:uncharacterized protein YdhG (YjbR/CyaY superfamily)